MEVFTYICSPNSSRTGKNVGKKANYPLQTSWKIIYFSRKLIIIHLSERILHNSEYYDIAKYGYDPIVIISLYFINILYSFPNFGLLSFCSIY